MKSAMRALLIAPGPMVANVMNGRKQMIIREGHRDYAAGQVIMIGCHVANWAVLADVSEVRHCRAAELTMGECESDGFDCLEAAIAGLQKYYPHLTKDSPVTVLRWDRVRGMMLGNV